MTREGQGKVIGQEILSKQVVIVYEDRRRITTPLQEIISVIKPKSAKKAAKKAIVSEDVSEEEE